VLRLIAAGSGAAINVEKAQGHEQQLAANCCAVPFAASCIVAQEC
jgi:hypothetical protein